MFKCENCERFFDDDECEYTYQAHPYGMGYAYEEFWCCPHCRSTEVLEYEMCDKCEEYFPTNEMCAGLCEKCYEETYDDEENDE